ncbi:MAG: hypothetical protein GX769_01285 [Erysipelothrix sp.]|nr:hypothetical protein [Erysipelothrix sp.]
MVDIHQHVKDYFGNLFSDDFSFTLEEKEQDEKTHYHTELQMCSIIANAFIAKQANYFEE